MTRPAVYYLYDSEYEEYISELRQMQPNSLVRFVALDAYNNALLEADLKAASHLIVTGDYPLIKQVFELARRRNFSVGIVPLPSQKRLAKIYDLPLQKNDAFRAALMPSRRKIDLLYCNGIPVINDLRIGNTSALKEFEYDYSHLTLLKRLRLVWSSWREKSLLRHYRFSIRRDSKEEIQLSAVGLIAMNHNNRSWISKILSRLFGANDGRLLLTVLAPRSLVGHFLIQPFVLLLSRGRSGQLPDSLGYVKGREVKIECDEPIEAVVDDNRSMQTPVSLRTVEKTLSLSVGEGFWEQNSADANGKSSLQLDNIPRDDDQIKYLKEGLPLFSHASTEQFATLFASLREEGRLGKSFVTLLLLSTLIATLGLFINSSSVIIGAMLLAPLMQPIVSLSMGALRQDSALELSSAKTVLVGVFIVLLVSAGVAWMIPVERITSEMVSRLSPTLLDLFVAIASGIAAAYGKSNEKVIGTLAGVAIAVALVPPIAVAGIGLGWGEWHMFMHAFLLFLTNFVGIVLAASTTFMVLGFSPIRIAKKGLLIWSLVVALIAFPLYHSYVTMQEGARIQSALSHKTFTINSKQVELAHVELIRQKPMVTIECEVFVDQPLDRTEKMDLRRMIERKIDVKTSNILVTFRYRL